MVLLFKQWIGMKAREKNVQRVERTIENEIDCHEQLQLGKERSKTLKKTANGNAATILTFLD